MGRPVATQLWTKLLRPRSSGSSLKDLAATDGPNASPLLFFAQMNAEHVVLPIGEDASPVFGLSDPKEKDIPH